MKKGLLSMAMMFAACGIGNFALAQEAREVSISVQDAYIPSGFDSKSDAFVVVNGYFPNSCYRWERSEVTEKTVNVHEVRSYAMVQPGPCLMMLMPFTKEIHLGQLSSGTHLIHFMGGDGTYLEKKMVIE